MKILITGVHGFVGSNLVEALKKEHTIYGLDIISPMKDGVQKTFSWDDLEKVGSRFKVQDSSPETCNVKPATDSLAELASVDAIIHLAGKAHDTKNQSAAEVYFKVNTGLTERIFDWFLKQPKCKKFVFFSTAKAAADKVDGVLTEDVVPAPVGPYGESKIKAEEYIISKFQDSGFKFQVGSQSSKSEENLQENHSTSRISELENSISHTESTDNTENASTGSATKQVYIFRPCMIHGLGNKGNLNLLYNVVRKGIPWPLGAFENRRTFTSVENICFAVNGVLIKDVPSGIYNMGDDEALSTNELIEEICKSLGKKAHIWKLPKGMMTGFAKVGDALHLPLNSERLRKLTENYISSNAKIKAALGIEKFPVNAREGLQATLKSFKG
ncbi:MAG: NAD-dependent epimerase/dehydratase family protein [Bacteroidales bacterium]|nr:NAD-dependent epimerase/dehydratase family protein [Bacteroidales bacterium]